MTDTQTNTDIAKKGKSAKQDKTQTEALMDAAIPQAQKEGVRPRETDGAPAGYTYRLLLDDHAEWGARGRILTLTHAQAEGLDPELFTIPTDAQKAVGLA